MCFFFFFQSLIFLICFFFFQAEDGIRDSSVTGVQTCALPISITRESCEGGGPPRGSRAIRKPSGRITSKRSSRLSGRNGWAQITEVPATLGVRRNVLL